MEIPTRHGSIEIIQAGSVLRLGPCILLLWCVASAGWAGPIYRCVDTHGLTTFRDTPCAVPARQTKLDLAGQPLIDPSTPRHAATPQISQPAAQRRARHAHASSRRHQQPMSWECQAANGEVFYRHTRCPSSIPGDGVVRTRYAETFVNLHSRTHHNAWSRVRVHGVKIQRSEACRRIHSAGAAGRDGHRRDATVSTYDHLMGRDPCAGS